MVFFSSKIKKSYIFKLLNLNANLLQKNKRPQQFIVVLFPQNTSFTMINNL
jgi:hypothetical protein